MKLDSRLNQLEKSKSFEEMAEVLNDLKVAEFGTTGGRRFEDKNGSYSGNVSHKRLLTCVEKIIQNQDSPEDLRDNLKAQQVLATLVKLDSEASTAAAKDTHHAGRRIWAQRLGNCFYTPKQQRMEKMHSQLYHEAGGEKSVQSALITLRQVAGKNTDWSWLREAIATYSSKSKDSTLEAILNADNRQVELLRDLLDELRKIEGKETSELYQFLSSCDQYRSKVGPIDRLADNTSWLSELIKTQSPRQQMEAILAADDEKVSFVNHVLSLSITLPGMEEADYQFIKECCEYRANREYSDGLVDMTLEIFNEIPLKYPQVFREAIQRYRSDIRDQEEDREPVDYLFVAVLSANQAELEAMTHLLDVMEVAEATDFELYHNLKLACDMRVIRDIHEDDFVDMSLAALDEMKEVFEDAKDEIATLSGAISAYGVSTGLASVAEGWIDDLIAKGSHDLLSAIHLTMHVFNPEGEDVADPLYQLILRSFDEHHSTHS